MTAPKINFHYEIKDFNLEDPNMLADWLTKVGHEENGEIALLNYIFCSDEYLLEINRKYLDHDFYTDIISFPLKTDPIEGDIFISIERVRENADTYGTEFYSELYRVIVHGLLHFLGYDDHDDTDIIKMREKEEYYLQLIEKGAV